LVKLLSKTPKNRFQNLAEIKENLIELRKNIFATPQRLRELLRHPVLPGEKLSEINYNQNIDFKGMQMNKFALKYLAKFICEFPQLQSISINGSPMPIRDI